MTPIPTPGVPQLIEQLTNRDSRHPVKVLLVIRNGAAFNQAIRLEVQGVAAASWPTLTLKPNSSEGDRRRWFGRAVSAYAAAANRPLPAGVLGDKRPVGESGESMVVTQVRAALSVLADQPAQGALPFRMAPIQDLGAGLVEHERHRWQVAAKDPRWRLPKKLTDEGCDEAMLALIALAPSSPKEAADALRRLPRFAKHEEDRLRRITAWAHHLYPSATAGRTWVDPSPDFILGAILANLNYPDRGSLVDELDVASAAQQRPLVLIRLARAMQQFPILSSTVEALLSHSPELVITAVEYMVSAGLHDDAMQSMIAGIITSYPLPDQSARRLLDLTTGPAWTRLGIALQRSVVHAARDACARENTNATRANLASLLNSLDVDLAAVGQVREALTVTQESVDIRRELVKSEPARYTADLASSLHNLGVRLAAVGQVREALTATQESVDIHRELVKSEPARYTADLASSLHSLGVRLADVGQVREALTATQEAVDIHRELVKSEPARYTADLVSMLKMLADRYIHQGDLINATACRGEVAARWRHLAGLWPDKFSDRYRHEHAELLQFCSQHDIPLEDGVRAEHEASQRISGMN